MPRTLALAVWDRLADLFRRALESRYVVNLHHQMHRAPDCLHVLLFGEIDLALREDLRRLLNTAVADAALTELDLHQVTYLDCVSIGEIVRAHLEARRRGRTLIVIRPQGMVREVLALTNVLSLLTPDPASAAAGQSVT